MNTATVTVTSCGYRHWSVTIAEVVTRSLTAVGVAVVVRDRVLCRPVLPAGVG